MARKPSRSFIYVCTNLQKAHLEKQGIREMNIMTCNKPQNLSCNNVDTKVGNEIIKKVPDVFKGLGHLKGEPVKVN